MDLELRNILRNVAIDERDDSFTHFSFYGPKCRWSIKSQDITEFWSSYCDLIDKKMNGRDGFEPEPYADICLAEKAQEKMPVIARIIMKFLTDEDNANWEPYDEGFLESLCSIYQQVLIENFEINTDPEAPDLVVVVLESSTHWFETDKESGNRFLCSEIRLQFPFTLIEASIQNRIVRTNVIKRLRNTNLLAKLDRQPIGDWEKIIAADSVNSPVPLYGSTEVKDRPKLEVSHFWGSINEDETAKDLNIEEVIKPEYHRQVMDNTIDKVILQENTNPIHWLPLFLSVNYWNFVTKLKVTDNARFGPQRNPLSLESPRAFGSNNNNGTVIENDETDFELCERMIGMIDVKRYREESSWLDIGKALYTSDSGKENGLAAWINHTERNIKEASNIPEFMIVAGSVSDTCTNIYTTLANNHITVKTLAWYAREDSPTKYGSWHKDWCYQSMERALSCLHTDVAIALYRWFWLDYVYCSVGKGKWYHFRNHRWNEMNQGINLRQIISSSFMKKFENIRAGITRQIHDSNDENWKNNAEITVKKITTLIGKLKTVAFKSSIMTEAIEQFNNDRFETLLNSNPDLTGVINGILEVAKDRVIFRPAKPEDFISMCTNIPYNDKFTWEHALVRECMKWMEQVFTDKSLRDHFLKFAASGLKGKNSDKIFPIFSGDGDNSKSMIVKLFEMTFGVYCIKFPVALLTEKNMNSSGPTPQLARAKATRFAFLDEPEDDVPMQKGTIKRYTGGDSFFARQLHSDGADIQASFKVVLMCNKVPVIPNADRAIKNRARIFPFLSTWCDDASIDEDIQMAQRRFKKNPFFEHRIPILAPAFLWIITNIYPRYFNEGLKDPEVVTEYTKNYWRDNDVYAQFSSDLIQEVKTEKGDYDSSVRTTLTEIYTQFKVWFKDTFPGTKVPERAIVKSELSSRWGRLVGNSWHGIRLITEEAPSDLATSLAAGLAPKKPPRNLVLTEKIPEGKQEVVPSNLNF